MTASTDAPGGRNTITVSPRSFALPPGHSIELHITIESVAPVGQQQFGTIRLKTDRALLHLPVAFIHTQGDVGLVQSCTPLTVQRNGRTECTVEAANEAFGTQAVELDTTTPTIFDVGPVDGATRVDRHHVHLKATLAGSHPGVPSVGPEGFGYFGLEQFGVIPDPIGDEGIELQPARV